MPKTRNIGDLPRHIDDGLVEQHNQLLDALGALGALPHHERTTAVSAAAATDLATSVALANDIRARYVAHIADTDAHAAADATNTVTAVAATDLATVNTLVNEIKGDLNAHIALASVHRGVGGAGGVTIATVTTANGTDQTTANALCNALKAALNNHVRAGAPNLALVAS